MVRESNIVKSIEVIVGCGTGCWSRVELVCENREREKGNERRLRNGEQTDGEGRREKGGSVGWLVGWFVRGMQL